MTLPFQLFGVAKRKPSQDSPVQKSVLPAHAGNVIPLVQNECLRLNSKRAKAVENMPCGSVRIQSTTNHTEQNIVTVKVEPSQTKSKSSFCAKHQATL